MALKGISCLLNLKVTTATLSLIDLDDCRYGCSLGPTTKASPPLSVCNVATPCAIFVGRGSASLLVSCNARKSNL